MALDVGILYIIHAVYSVALGETADFVRDVLRQIFDIVSLTPDTS